LEKDIFDWFFIRDYKKAIELFNNVESYENMNTFEACLLIYMLV